MHEAMPILSPVSPWGHLFCWCLSFHISLISRNADQCSARFLSFSSYPGSPTRYALPVYCADPNSLRNGIVKLSDKVLQYRMPIGTQGRDNPITH